MDSSIKYISQLNLPELIVRTNRSIHPPIRYTGSKFRAAKYIIPHLQKVNYDEYREPFLGCGAIFFATPTSKFSWLNDVDNDLITTFRVIADATSTLSDIDRAYSLGWLTKKVHDDLAKKLKACNVKKTTVTNVTKTIVVTGKNGKITTKKVQEKVTKVEIVFDKNCAKAMLKEFDKYRNKGLNEQAYQLLKEDINWIINN